MTAASTGTYNDSCRTQGHNKSIYLFWNIFILSQLNKDGSKLLRVSKSRSYTAKSRNETAVNVKYTLKLSKNKLCPETKLQTSDLVYSSYIFHLIRSLDCTLTISCLTLSNLLFKIAPRTTVLYRMQLEGR